MQLWLWTLTHLQEAKDANGAPLYHGNRQGVTFPLADALCWLLAVRAQILDVLVLESRGADNPALADALPGAVQFFTDLCHVQSARATGEAGRICAELVMGYLRHASWDDPNAPGCMGGDEVDELEGLIPGFASGARIYMDVIEADGSHATKAGPCVKFTGLETFRALRSRLDGCLTGSRLAKDRAADALTRVMIPEVQITQPDDAAGGLRHGHGRGRRLRGFRARDQRLPHHAGPGALTHGDGTPRIESRVAPGLPLQVLCFERADDAGAGVSGVVTRARGIRASFPAFDPADVPMTTRVTRESLVYLLDPIGASRRSRPLRLIDGMLRATGGLLIDRHAVRLPFVPGFLNKHDGLIFSLGQFSQWVAGQVMATGAAQVWPASPVATPLFEGNRVAGIRLVDQGTNARGEPGAGFVPGMDGHAALTVVGDGPVGAVGRALDAKFGLPEGHVRDEWALGMKMVVDLREGVDLEPGMVLHTFGFPEPEIFGFLCVLAPRTVSVGIFGPSWFRASAHGLPVPAALDDASVSVAVARRRHAAIVGRQVGAGIRPARRPHLVGDGYARIGEGSGSTNALTGSGGDEAWTTGTRLAEAVVELAQAGQAFTKENLDRAYVTRRRASWLDRELRVAEGARDGFDRGVIWGLTGMGLAGLTRGLVRLPGRRRVKPLPSLDEYFAGRISADEIARIRQRSTADGEFDARCVHGTRRRAGHPLRWAAARLASGRAADGRPGAGARRLRESRAVQEGPVRYLRTHLCVDMCSGQPSRRPGGGVARSRNAYTVARASGTARPRRTQPVPVPTWTSVPAPADCIPSKTRFGALTTDGLSHRCVRRHRAGPAAIARAGHGSGRARPQERSPAARRARSVGESRAV
jgi:electron-transferring-flavoprotein dehydrogenase